MYIHGTFNPCVIFYSLPVFYGIEYETKYDTLVPGQQSNVLEQDAERIDDLYETVIKKRRLEFPSHLPNFENCELRSAMCCWVQDRQAGDNNGNCKTPYDDNCIDKDPADNTDLCAVDFERSGSDSVHIPGGDGFAIFPEDGDDGEGAVHCHGIAWDIDEHDLQSRFKGNNMFYVSMYDHMHERGYVRNVPGGKKHLFVSFSGASMVEFNPFFFICLPAPMCGCVEKMPIVTRADCTEMSTLNIWKLEWDIGTSGLSISLDRSDLSFAACESRFGNNNLEKFYKRLEEEGRATEEDHERLKKTLVGSDGCDSAVSDLFLEKGFELNPVLPGWTQVYGRGGYSYPDETQEELWSPWYEGRYTKDAVFYVRRLCNSCSKDSHKDIIYKRRTTVPDEMDFRDLLLDDWNDREGNHFHDDFDLFSTFEDAVNDENPWSYCNFNSNGVGCKFWYFCFNFILCNDEILTCIFVI
jgi:hypothetical protein